MSRNDWEKSPNDKREEAFYAPDNSKIRAKAKKVDKPFLVETRYQYVANRVFQFMLEWSGKRKFETLELAQIYAKKLNREARSDRREVRITDTRDGSQHAVD
jgi:hypothetical protein